MGMRVLLMVMLVAVGCSSATSSPQTVSGPDPDKLEIALVSAWEGIGGMERESRPTLRWIAPSCDELTVENVSSGACGSSSIDSSGVATIAWTGHLSDRLGLPTALSTYRNWLRYSSFLTHTDEQADFARSMSEGLASIGL